MRYAKPLDPSPEQAEEIVRMLNDCVSIDDISKHLRVGKDRVNRWIRDNGIMSEELKFYRRSEASRRGAWVIAERKRQKGINLDFETRIRPYTLRWEEAYSTQPFKDHEVRLRK